MNPHWLRAEREMITGWKGFFEIQQTVCLFVCLLAGPRPLGLVMGCPIEGILPQAQEVMAYLSTGYYRLTANPGIKQI